MLGKYQTTLIQLFTLCVVETASLPHSTPSLWACKWPTNFNVSRVQRMCKLVWMDNVAWKTVHLVLWQRNGLKAIQWFTHPIENQKGPLWGRWCRRRIFQGHIFCHSLLSALIKATIHRKSSLMPMGNSLLVFLTLQLILICLKKYIHGLEQA